VNDMMWPEINEWLEPMFEVAERKKTVRHEICNGLHYFLHEDGSVAAIMGDDMFTAMSALYEQERKL